MTLNVAMMTGLCRCDDGAIDYVYHVMRKRVTALLQPSPLPPLRRSSPAAITLTWRVSTPGYVKKHCNKAPSVSLPPPRPPTPPPELSMRLLSLSPLFLCRFPVMKAIKGTRSFSCRAMLLLLLLLLLATPSPHPTPVRSSHWLPAAPTSCPSCSSCSRCSSTRHLLCNPQQPPIVCRAPFRCPGPLILLAVPILSRCSGRLVAAARCRGLRPAASALQQPLPSSCPPPCSQCSACPSCNQHAVVSTPVLRRIMLLVAY